MIGPAMRRVFWSWRSTGALLLVLALVPADSAGETLTIATYNLQNYTVADRMAAGVYRAEYPKPELEKAALRQVIRALDADVLVLQELGGEPFLEELRRDLATEGVHYAHAVYMRAEDEARGLGALSKIPLHDVVRHTDMEFAYLGGRERVRRGMLELGVGREESRVTLFVVHLKSRYTERDDDPASVIRRGAEATAARDRLLERFPDPGAEAARFLVLGDFNDSPTSRAVRAFTRRGDNLEIAALVPVADSRGETWTHVYRREDAYTRVDHVMVSAALLPRVAGGRATIFDGPGTAEASDHRPVIVTLEREREGESRP